MLKPLLPIDETARLMSLLSMRILDTPADPRLDRITRMTKQLFRVDICLISLVDAQRVWFKSAQGVTDAESSRETSFCAHAILSDEIFVVEDSSEDIRFANNPSVIGAPNIRFYAGIPIRDPSGYRMGTLCIIDANPRTMSAADTNSLRDLGAMVESELQMSAQVTIDELTQIANRRGFHMVANHLLSLCRRTGTSAELVLFDLAGFKAINDEFSYTVGDELLRYFANLLVECFRSADVIARLGGDEFVVLMGGSSSSADNALRRLAKAAAATDSEIRRNLAWSVGIIQIDPSRHDSIETLMADADLRMYDDKQRRRMSGM